MRACEPCGDESFSTNCRAVSSAMDTMAPPPGGWVMSALLVLKSDDPAVIGFFRLGRGTMS